MDYQRTKRGFWFAALIFLASLCHAQVDTGTPAYGSFGGGPFDAINLGNLNSHFAVPMVSKPGRKMGFSYAMAYDSSVWVPTGVPGIKPGSLTVTGDGPGKPRWQLDT